MNPATLASPSLTEPDLTAELARPYPRPALEITEVEPQRFEKRGGTYFVDFGKAAWGNLQIAFDRVPSSDITVRLGEKISDNGTIDREPPGSLVFRELTLSPQPGQTVYQLQIPSHWMHSDPMAVAMPSEIGEVTIFRYAELEGVTESLRPSQVRQLFIHAAFDDEASSFHSSDATLNAVWDLCKYTMKATTAFGVYIDGERERIPYEADAYINQLSHLACDFNPAIARASIEHLLAHPTWPTEWSFHTIMMVAADYEATGDRDFVMRNYSALHEKLFMDKARGDGLLRLSANIDWPKCERDNYNNGEVFPGDPDSQLGPVYNTVANAFYFHSLERMALLAGGVGKYEESALYNQKAQQVFESFNLHLFDSEQGVYVDGVSDNNELADHVSLHANMFALAFGLVPAERLESVADYVESRGMACSVYGSQYLLEALFRAGRDNAGLRLMTSHDERSWWHMIELGSTMTLEAWDEKFKSNLTWSHAWGAAPANIITRFVLGVRPLKPGYRHLLIAPQPGSLQEVNGTVPTPLGPVEVCWQNDGSPSLEVTIPDGVTAQVKWPRETDTSIQVDGISVPIHQDGESVVGKILTAGHHILTP